MNLKIWEMPLLNDEISLYEFYLNSSVAAGVPQQQEKVPYL